MNTDELSFDKEAVVKASYESLKNIVDRRSYKYFTWDNDSTDYEPLLVDLLTAHMMTYIHDNLNPKNQPKFKEWIGKSRIHFVRLVDFGWNSVSRR